MLLLDTLTQACYFCRAFHFQFDFDPTDPNNAGATHRPPLSPYSVRGACYSYEAVSVKNYMSVRDEHLVVHVSVLR